MPSSDFIVLVASYDNNTTVDTAVAASPYSVVELKAAAAAAGSADDTVVAAALESDSSGIVLETSSPQSASSKNVSLRSGKLTARASSYLKYVKKYAYIGGAPTPAVATRQNDSNASPGWNGGARIRWPNGGNSYGVCSSGFGVTLSGFEYLISAAHCRANNSATQDGAGQSMGLTTNWTPGNDYMWVKVSNASNRVYVGAWNTTSGSYRRVVGTVGNSAGSYTCQSGASTGTNCDTKIINENYFYKINNINQWGVRAERQASNVRAIGTGDSGGPVLKNTSNASNILAAGIISAGNVDVSCPNAGTNRCFRQVIYKRIQTARDNGTIITS